MWSKARFRWTHPYGAPRWLANSPWKEDRPSAPVLARARIRRWSELMLSIYPNTRRHARRAEATWTRPLRGLAHINRALTSRAMVTRGARQCLQWTITRDHRNRYTQCLWILTTSVCSTDARCEALPLNGGGNARTYKRVCVKCMNFKTRVWKR